MWPYSCSILSICICTSVATSPSRLLVLCREFFAFVTTDEQLELNMHHPAHFQYNPEQPSLHLAYYLLNTVSGQYQKILLTEDKFLRLSIKIQSEFTSTKTSYSFTFHNLNNNMEH